MVISFPRTIPLGPGEEEPRYEAFSVRSDDGVELRMHEWSPAGSARGIVFLLHGIGMYGAPYHAVAPAFGRVDLILTTVDVRGHGRSGGKRAVLFPRDRLLADLDAALDAIALRHPGAPVFLAGESMGGLLAAEYAWQRQERLHGLVLMAPALSTRAVKVDPFGAIASLLSRGRILIDSERNLRASSRDPGFIAAKKSDPLVTHEVSLLYLTRLGFWGLHWPATARSLTLPLCLVLGGKDRIVKNRVALRSFEWAATPAPQKRLIRWPGAYHTLCWDPDAIPIFKEVTSWLISRLA